MLARARQLFFFVVDCNSGGTRPRHRGVSRVKRNKEFIIAVVNLLIGV